MERRERHHWNLQGMTKNERSSPPSFPLRPSPASPAHRPNASNTLLWAIASATFSTIYSVPSPPNPSTAMCTVSVAPTPISNVFPRHLFQLVRDVNIEATPVTAIAFGGKMTKLYSPSVGSGHRGAGVRALQKGTVEISASGSERGRGQ